MKVTDDAHFRILRLLEAEPELSQRQIADRLGISLGRVNYLLRALAEKGQVKVRNFRGAPNKLRYAYLLTPKGVEAKARLTAGFLRRKVAEYEALRAEIDALEGEVARQVAEIPPTSRRTEYEPD